MICSPLKYIWKVLSRPTCWPLSSSPIKAKQPKYSPSTISLHPNFPTDQKNYNNLAANNPSKTPLYVSTADRATTSTPTTPATITSQDAQSNPASCACTAQRDMSQTLIFHSHVYEKKSIILIISSPTIPHHPQSNIIYPLTFVSFFFSKKTQTSISYDDLNFYIKGFWTPICSVLSFPPTQC